MKEVAFDPQTLLILTYLQEQRIAVDNALQRYVVFFAKSQGIDPEKNNIRFDVAKGKFSYEPVTEVSKTAG